MTLPAESDETTHFSVIDRDGMAVSNTYTLEGGYGSHVVIKGTGILLNNEMGDFNKKPGTTDLTGNIGTPPNVIAPGKRMLSSMTPAIVTKAGKVVLITGIAGRPHDHQHVAQRRAERHGVGPDRPRGRRRCAVGSRMAAGSVRSRRGRGIRGRAREAARDGPHGARAGPAGIGALDLGSAGHGRGVRRQRQARCDVQGIRWTIVQPPAPDRTGTARTMNRFGAAPTW